MSEIDFSELHDGLRTVAREVLSKAGEAGVDWKVVADSGWIGLDVPDELGGSGATFAELAVVLDEIGRAAAAGPFLGAAVLGTGALDLLEPTAARDELLGALVSGEVVVTTALVSGEAGLGGAPFHLAGSGGSLTLSGEATFVPDATEAGRVLALALDGDDQPVLVDLAVGAGGLSVQPQPVLDATRRFGQVVLTDLSVDPATVHRFAGDPALAVARLYDRAATAVACDSLGLSEAMLAATVAYVKVREQFGRPIGSFQAVKHACADMYVETSISRQLVTAAVSGVAADAADRAVLVSMAKSHACGGSVDIVGKAMQLHGGMGYTWESGIHVYLKRAVLNRSLFGSVQAHRARLSARYTR